MLLTIRHELDVTVMNTHADSISIVLQTGCTALHCTVKLGHVAHTEVLLKSGASTSIRDKVRITQQIIIVSLSQDHDLEFIIISL